ncbi:MAG: leucyl aminopeptidase [bacterium]|jgi:leucyl aminopeptidase
MEIKVTARFPKIILNACQIFFLFSDGKLKGAARKVDAGSGNAIKTVIKNEDFSGVCGQTLVLHAVTGSTTDRVMLVGLGDRANASSEQWFEACAAAATALCATPSAIGISDCLMSCPIDSMSMDEQASHFTCELIKSTYLFDLHDGKNTPRGKALKQFFLSVDKSSINAAANGAMQGVAIGHGIAVAKNLGNLAPNICTPEYLANSADAMAQQFENISTTVLEESDMEALGMGALLAVSRGSRRAAKLIVMNYQGRKRAGSPIVLIGKGVTFDAGGISIKPSAAMDEMKFDMCGAASVFGAMQTVAELSLNLNIIGIVAAAENMPGGDAARPGDVVTSMSGQSIEILNTDAEGRLVLCDALTYAERFKPSVVIDIATLTGACVVALGDVASAVMGNHQDTIDALLSASKKSGDHCWQLPLLPAYQKQLASNFADMANIGGSKAGAITAGCFLSRFATTMNWAHLDVAGTAWNSGAAKGATGRPVPLLMQYIIDRAEET